MDFQLNDEQQQLRRSVREFAQREIAPHVMEWDEASKFPLEAVKELGRLGLLGIIFPAEYGGAGASFISDVRKVSIALAAITFANSLGCASCAFTTSWRGEKPLN